jgi:hypothetical protein
MVSFVKARTLIFPSGIDPVLTIPGRRWLLGGGVCPGGALAGRDGGLNVSVLASYLPTLVFVAGVGQLALIVASLAIPRVLRWREETAKLRPLTRQVFWTYAIYIWATNLSFGLVSLRPDWLLDRSPLAGCVTGFITAYWMGRVLIQFFYFDRSDTPPGLLVRLAELNGTVTPAVAASTRSVPLLPGELVSDGQR